MPDCLNCSKCIRQEVYDGQWGMFYFTNVCSVGVSVIINGRVNPYTAPCDMFEKGSPKVVYKTEKEKQKYKY